MPKDSAIRQIVLPLAAAEIIIWASIFYSFPALLLQWETDLGWSKIELSGAFSLALVISALLAPIVGRLIDNGYAQKVFTGCSIFAALMLAAMSLVEALWQFYLVWAGIGIAMSGSLYEPCFAVLTRAMGTNAKRAITTVTLIAGFAGTLSFPIINTLADWLGWRSAVLIVAVLALLIPPVLFWRATGRAERLWQKNRSLQRVSANTSHDATGQLLKSASFWLLGISFAMIALNHGVLITHILPLLNERGVHRDTAVFAAAMIGPMQVVGRLAMMSVENYVSTFVIACMSFLLMGLAGIILLGAAVAPFLLVGFVLFHGAGYGVTSITRPVVIAEFMGQNNYGAIAGMLATPFLLMTAASPTVASIVWEYSGYNGVICLAIGATVVGLLCLLAASKSKTKAVEN